MTDLSTEAVNAALEAATDGPWITAREESNYSVLALHMYQQAAGTVACAVDSYPELSNPLGFRNARLIAMAPDLAAEVLLLRAVLGGIRDVLSNPSMTCASDRLDEIETLLSDVPDT